MSQHIWTLLASLFLIAISGCDTTTTQAIAQDESVRQIDIGQNHFCAVTQGGALVCWGDNRNGQIGNGLDDSRARKPTLIIAHGVTQVSAGYALASFKLSSLCEIGCVSRELG